MQRARCAATLRASGRKTDQQKQQEAGQRVSEVKGAISRGSGGRPRYNEHGGIYVDRDELKVAFSFFDSSGCACAQCRRCCPRLTAAAPSRRSGVITKQDLHEKLPIFYKNAKPKEMHYLLKKQNKITFDGAYMPAAPLLALTPQRAELYEILSTNELTDFDPVAEAFKARSTARRRRPRA